MAPASSPWSSRVAGYLLHCCTYCNSSDCRGQRRTRVRLRFPGQDRPTPTADPNQRLGWASLATLGTVDRDGLIRVFRALDQGGVEYTLVGSAALGMHGIIRGTEDLDLLIKASGENVQRIVAALQSAYRDDPSIAGIQADDLLGDYPVVRYYPPSEQFCLDLIAGIGDKETFESVEAATMEYRGVRIRVATPAALHRLKRGTLRPVDRQDAAALRANFDFEEDS